MNAKTVRPVSDYGAHRGNPNDRSVRAFVVRPSTFSALLYGFWGLTAQRDWAQGATVVIAQS